MVFHYEEYHNKFRKCPYQTDGLCSVNQKMIENPTGIIANCGNCMTNTDEPNLF